MPAGCYLARLLMVGIETGVSKMDQPGLHCLRVQDRAELAKLLTALNGAMNALRRGECGDPTIFGSRGHIHACDGKFYVYVQCRSALHWTHNSPASRWSIRTATKRVSFSWPK